MMSEEQVTGWQAKIHVQDTTELSSEVDLRGLAEGARQTGLQGLAKRLALVCRAYGKVPRPLLLSESCFLV